MAARTCERLQLIDSQILKGKHARATYGSVFPEPGPHGSVITSTWHAQSWGRQEARSLNPIYLFIYLFVYKKTSIWWRESGTVLAEEPVLAWRQLHQMVLLSSPPSWNEITEIFMPPVRSPAISPAVQHAPSSSLHTLTFIIISFSCSSASLMIRISRSLILRHKKGSHCAVYVPGFDFETSLFTTAEIINIIVHFKIYLRWNLSNYNLFLMF